MTSTKKIAASRRNATKSTGPKTAQGKKRARTNALRHGLAAIAPRDPATSAEIERLARWFCGDGATPEQYEHARAIAEEHVILQRVETAWCLPPVEATSPDAAAPCEGKPGHETRVPGRGSGRRSGAYAGPGVPHTPGPAERAADRGGARHR